MDERNYNVNITDIDALIEDNVGLAERVRELEAENAALRDEIEWMVRRA
jgi:hypothetical protein